MIARSYIVGLCYWEGSNDSAITRINKLTPQTLSSRNNIFNLGEKKYYYFFQEMLISASKH